MARAQWKGPFFDMRLLKKVLRSKGEYTKIKVHSRTSTILREFIDKEFEIHTGNSYITVKVTPDMLGHKFGEFASTRRYDTKKKKKGKK